jgi:tRNA dimethylallyltransferase
MSDSPRVWRVICGPTAAGKSAIALALAERHRLHVASADSRQLYRGFDIGTAKPTAAEQVRVRHYGIDICDPADRFSAHDWALAAKRWSRDAQESHHAITIVGGTGFYIRALVEPLHEVPALDPSRRAELSAWLETLDQETLRVWCARLDPARAHLGRTQRLRAIETALLTGTPLSASFAAGARPSFSSTRYLVVDPGPILAQRIADRVDAMIGSGWPDEVERLMTQVPAEAPAWKASGYGTMRAAVQGQMSLRAAREAIVIETRQYAKRQRTWFRHQLPADAVTRLDASAPDAIEQAERWWAHEERSDV